MPPRIAGRAAGPMYFCLEFELAKDLETSNDVKTTAAEAPGPHSSDEVDLKWTTSKLQMI